MKILLIEDDLDDVELLEDALKTRDVVYTMETLNDGSAALDHIASCTSTPDIIILDFNLPKVHGREVLMGIKSSGYAAVPLMVLTTSSAKEDIDFAYSKGAVRYFTKPTTLADFDKIIGSIVELGTKRRLPS